MVTAVEKRLQKKIKVLAAFRECYMVAVECGEAQDAKALLPALRRLQHDVQELSEKL